MSEREPSHYAELFRQRLSSQGEEDGFTPDVRALLLLYVDFTQTVIDKLHRMEDRLLALERNVAILMHLQARRSATTVERAAEER